VARAALPRGAYRDETPPGDITADIRAMIAAARDVFHSPLVARRAARADRDMPPTPSQRPGVMDASPTLSVAVRTRLPTPVKRGECRADVRPKPGSSRLSRRHLLLMLLRPYEPLVADWVDQPRAIVVHGVVGIWGR